MIKARTKVINYISYLDMEKMSHPCLYGNLHVYTLEILHRTKSNYNSIRKN